MHHVITLAIGSMVLHPLFYMHSLVISKSICLSLSPSSYGELDNLKFLDHGFQSPSFEPT